MSGASRLRLLGQAWVLMAVNFSAQAGEATVPAGCFEEEVLLHVRAQFAKYGPRSDRNEYFGFIYRKDDRIESAVTYGSDCRGQTDCTTNPAFARARIPHGARVLGEWHTHPRIGARELSMDDVSGAHANRHIRCYAAFYSSPDGEIYRWSVDSTSVPAAMASLTPIGNYRAPLVAQPGGVVAPL
jgi:hypothetical protein